MEFFGSFDEFLRIGNTTITMYAVCILIGAALATLISVREGKLLGLNTSKIIDGILIGLLFGIAGARLYYVLFEWDKFYIAGDLFATFKNIIDISSGGLAITGGIIVAVIYAYVYCKMRNLNILKILDLLAPGMLIAQACGRWGNFFNHEAYGGVMSESAQKFLYAILPDFIMDNMYIGGAYHHPTFLYECLWNLVGLAIILIARKYLKKIQIGDFIGFYLIWYGIGRATLIEPFRTDALMLGDIRINIVIPALFAIGGIIYLIVKHVKFPQPSYVLDKQRIIEEGPTEEEINKDNAEESSLIIIIKNKIKKFLDFDSNGREELDYDEIHSREINYEEEIEKNKENSENVE